VATLLLANEEPFATDEEWCGSKGPAVTTAATVAPAVAEGFKRVFETLPPP